MGYRSLWLALAVAALLPLAASAEVSGSYRPETVSTAVAIVRPSVVAIETRFKEPVIKDEYGFWQALRGARPLYGLWGTGFVYKDPNYVVTTSFLMSDAQYERVILDDGRSYKATLVGKDEDLDVAVLKVDWGPDLTPISPPFGNSDKLVLGEPIAIVGKALNSVDTFTSFGVISAIRKEVPGTNKPTDQFLQFDASYELSYVGAPMVDVHGNVVGMVDQTVQDFSLTNINLAAPVNELIHAADRIISGENVKTWFGAEVQPMTQEVVNAGYAPKAFDWDGDGRAEPLDFGMFVTYVEPLSPADLAGIKAGDVIIEVNNQRLKFQYDWDKFLRELKVGQLVSARFIRNTGSHDAPAWKKQEAQVQIVQKPEEKKNEAGKSTGGSYHGTMLKVTQSGRNRNQSFAHRGGNN